MNRHTLQDFEVYVANLRCRLYPSVLVGLPPSFSDDIKRTNQCANNRDFLITTSDGKISNSFNYQELFSGMEKYI